MDQNNVLYAIENRCLYLVMTGAVRHTLCTNLDILLRKVMDKDDVDKFVIDLRPATYLDSTSLGLIARMARYMNKKKSGRLVLISTNDDVNQILNSVQFESIATIVDNWKNLPDTFCETEDYSEQVQSHRDLVLKSHQELAQINEVNRKKFAEIIQSLEKKYKKKSK